MMDPMDLSHGAPESPPLPGTQPQPAHSSRREMEAHMLHVTEIKHRIRDDGYTVDCRRVAEALLRHPALWLPISSDGASPSRRLGARGP
jgi:hypothetical protein